MNLVEARRLRNPANHRQPSQVDVVLFVAERGGACLFAKACPEVDRVALIPGGAGYLNVFPAAAVELQFEARVGDRFGGIDRLLGTRLFPFFPEKEWWTSGAAGSLPSGSGSLLRSGAANRAKREQEYHQMSSHRLLIVSLYGR